MSSLTEKVCVPDLIRANKDSYNDYFIIESNEPWELKIYNRWGHISYYNKHYKNDLRPYELEEGIYFYVLNNDETLHRGWIQVSKDYH